MTEVPGFFRHPGDGWVECACGRRHWGLVGAAGLLLVRRDDRGLVTHVVLQHRSLESHQGGTWGVPGGAIVPGETAVEGALRESQEEAGIAPGAVRVLGEHVLDHGPWSYTTVLAEEAPGHVIDVRPTDTESLDVVWVPADEVTDRELLPAFAAAWPGLRARIDALGPSDAGNAGF
jgi:8-oxo-dGTP diphosphatase